MISYDILSEFTPQIITLAVGQAEFSHKSVSRASLSQSNSISLKRHELSEVHHNPIQVTVSLHIHSLSNFTTTMR